MKSARVSVGLFAVLVLLALTAGYRLLRRVSPSPVKSTSVGGPIGRAGEEAHPSCLYGRITTYEGGTYEGRLRWGRDEEAFWGNYFNGARNENSWAASVPPEQLPKERNPIQIFGIEIVSRERPIDLDRLF